MCAIETTTLELVWTDRDITEAMRGTQPRIIGTPYSGAVQPTSLDLSPAQELWRLPASGLPRGQKVRDYIRRHASAHTQKFSNTILERGCVYLTKLDVGLKLPRHISARANPKSSIGRLDVFVRLLTDYAEEFDTVPYGYEGPLYAEIVPLTRPIMLDGSPMLQLRFRERGDVTFGKQFSVTPDLPITVDLHATDHNQGIIGYRFRREGDVIRLRDRGLSVRDNWEPVYSKNDTIILEPEAFYILASQEAVTVSLDEAAELMAYDVGLGEMRCHYAGFVETGFGLDASGVSNDSKLVLEVRGHDVPFMLQHGQRVGTLKYEKLLRYAERPYGSAGLNNTYQGQGLRLSKHFG